MVVYARSLVFVLGHSLSTCIFALFCIVLFPLPFPWRYGFFLQWNRFNIWWLEKTCGIRYVVVGRENIPSTNAIVLCKHQSAWETLALPLCLPPLAFVVKRELLWIPFFGWGLALVEPIAINRLARQKAIYQLLIQGRERLESGRWVVVFPEGTRISAGSKGVYALGGALLAERTGYTVIPVAHNAGECWPRRQFLKYSGTIHLTFGPAIESTGKSASEIGALAESWIEKTVGEMSRRETMSESKS